MLEYLSFILIGEDQKASNWEAQNMVVIETPLQMAAKNGCNAAARLLPHHGATQLPLLNLILVWSSLYF